MTTFTVKRRPAGKTFNNFMDDFFSPLPSIVYNHFIPAHFKQFAPVNVKKVENGYQLEVIAPGLERDNFKIELDKNLLTISAEKKDEATNNTEKRLRNEYRFQPFKRTFTVDETIDTEKIAAKYVNGVLTLNLPKKAEVEAPKKEITIA